jgi:poly-gamma-glutamate synthesis protein (capsule biosynthesis protein)
MVVPDAKHGPHGSACRLILCGDVMLGRNVGAAIQRNGADYPLGRIAGLLREGDLVIANLECAITSVTQVWSGMPKAFYFGAPEVAVNALTHAGIHLVSLANNHTLDFGEAGLADTLRDLNRHHISHAGAGADIDDALAPAIINCHGIRFGMVAFCNHQADFAAQQNQPGIAYVDLHDVRSATSVFHSALVSLQRAAVDWPVLSLHWGPNMEWRPSAEFRFLAHAAIDMGWKILFGHSAHVYQGIEIYRGCPIFYAAGDVVDDYYVDPDFRNDHQLIFELQLTRSLLQRIVLHPILIEKCQTRLATGTDFEAIAQQMTLLCDEMGTRVHREGEKIWVEGSGT